jgi:hypothetical protein
MISSGSRLTTSYLLDNVLGCLLRGQHSPKHKKRKAAALMDCRFLFTNYSFPFLPGLQGAGAVQA